MPVLVNTGELSPDRPRGGPAMGIGSSAIARAKGISRTCAVQTKAGPIIRIAKSSRVNMAGVYQHGLCE